MNNYLCHYDVKSMFRKAKEKLNTESKIDSAIKRYVDLMNAWCQQNYGVDYYPNGNTLRVFAGWTQEGSPFYKMNPDENVEEIYNNRANIRIQKNVSKSATSIREAVRRSRDNEKTNNSQVSVRKTDSNNKKRSSVKVNRENTNTYGSTAGMPQDAYDEYKKRKNFSDAQKKAAKSGHTVYHSDTLSHHGILGQKWGVRRFQNEDGSLTPAGKRRYSDMSDEELMTKARRLQAEENLYNLEKRAYERENPKKEESFGKKLAKDAFQSFVYKPIMGAGETYMKAVFGRAMRYSGAVISSGNTMKGAEFTKAAFEGNKIDDYVKYYQEHQKR